MSVGFLPSFFTFACSYKKEYIYVGKNLNWVEAVTECRSMEAELALIESEEQNTKVGNFLCRAHMGCKNWNLIGGVWIGYFLKQDQEGFIHYVFELVRIVFNP